MDGMNVYDFAPLDLSKEVEGSIFGVNCYKDKCLLSRSDSCIEGDWICRYEQAAIEGE